MGPKSSAEKRQFRKLKWQVWPLEDIAYQARGGSSAGSAAAAAAGNSLNSSSKRRRVDPPRAGEPAAAAVSGMASRDESGDDDDDDDAPVADSTADGPADVMLRGRVCAHPLGVQPSGNLLLKSAAEKRTVWQHRCHGLGAPPP